MQIRERGTVARDASARRQSMHAKAIMLTMGRARCPIPSGIMWASVSANDKMKENAEEKM